MGELRVGQLNGFYSGVTVDAVTPTYYDIVYTTIRYHFDVEGSWLTNLPDDARGWFSASNDTPMMGIQNGWSIRLVEKSFNHAKFEVNERFQRKVYLGCITSADGETVYWVNNTQPLPIGS